MTLISMPLNSCIDVAHSGSRTSQNSWDKQKSGAGEESRWRPVWSAAADMKTKAEQSKQSSTSNKSVQDVSVSKLFDGRSFDFKRAMTGVQIRANYREVKPRYVILKTPIC